MAMLSWIHPRTALGQLHKEMLSMDDNNFPSDSKLDYFRRNVLDTYLATHNLLPASFL